MAGVFETRVSSLVRKGGAVTNALGNTTAEHQATLVEDDAYSGNVSVAASGTLTLWTRSGTEKVGALHVEVSGDARLLLTFEDDADVQADEVFTIDLCHTVPHMQGIGTGKLIDGEAATLKLVRVQNKSSTVAIDVKYLIAL